VSEWLFLYYSSGCGIRVVGREAQQRAPRHFGSHIRSGLFSGPELPPRRAARQKAIDIFVKLAEVDGETAEIYLALGSLFRYRGDVDRAIRIHQNLVS